jgi:hypothetical protein
VFDGSLRSLLPLLDTRQRRLEVDDRRSVDRFQTADMYEYPINIEHAYPVEANRIGPARCPGAEDAGLWSAQVSARMDPQDGPVGLMQPAQDDDLVADRYAVQGRFKIVIQDQVGVRCAFVALPRRIGRRDEWTLDASNRAHCEVGGGGVSHGGHLITAPSRNSERIRQ